MSQLPTPAMKSATVFLWAFGGIFFGFLFPGLAILVDPNPSSAALMWIIWTVPIVLGTTFAMLGFKHFLLQESVEIRRSIEESRSLIWAYRTSELAHEVNNPLAIVLGILNKQQRKSPSPDTRSAIDAVRRVASTVSRMAAPAQELAPDAAVLFLSDIVSLSAILARELSDGKIQLSVEGEIGAHRYPNGRKLAYGIYQLLMSLCQKNGLDDPLQLRIRYLPATGWAFRAHLEVTPLLAKPSDAFDGSLVLPRTIIRSCGGDLRIGANGAPRIELPAEGSFL